MLGNRRLFVIMPAYNASKTLEQTWNDLPHDVVDQVILVDDSSQDKTRDVAAGLGIDTWYHKTNLGYGGNQKSCYQLALDQGADIVVMIHPDYQYSPRLVRAMAAMIGDGEYDLVLGSRILGKGALQGGMPLYKYVANRFLTMVQNLMINQKLSEYHTGLRAFSAKVLRGLPLSRNSDDFIFDNQMLLQAHQKGFRIGELSCPTRYFDEASSINFRRSCRYGFLCLWNSWRYMLHQAGIRRDPLFIETATPWYQDPPRHHSHHLNPPTGDTGQPGSPALESGGHSSI